MKEINLTIPVKEYSSEAELPAADRELVEAAKRATDGSYAPYSHFRVGAALRLANGKIVAGANQENAAFSAGTCGERSALYYAAANYPGVRIEKIAIAARTDSGFQKEPISPCGVCRQALMEYENRDGDMEAILYGEDRILSVKNIKSLLPLCFTEF